MEKLKICFWKTIIEREEEEIFIVLERMEKSVHLVERQSGEGKTGILIRFNYWMEFWRVVCRRGGKRVKGSRILEVVQTGGRRRETAVEVGML